MGQKQRIIAFILFFFGTILLLRTVLSLWNSYLPDFSVFYNSASTLLSHNNPYTNTKLFTQVNYPPIAIIFFYPFLLLSFMDASKLWLMLSVFFLLGSLYFLNKTHKVNILTFSIIFLATVNSFPFKFTLGMGQVNILLLFLLTLILYFLIKQKNIKAGAVLSFAISLKLFPVILFVLLRNHLKSLLLSISIITILFFLPIILNKIEISSYYFSKVLLPLMKESAGGVYYNQSITGFFSRVGISLILSLIIRFLIVIVTFVAIYKFKNKVFFCFSFLLTMVLLINNFSWQHHLILLVIPFYYLIVSKISKGFIFFLAISYLLIATNIKDPQQFASLWYGGFILSHAFFGILILWSLLLLQQRKIFYGKK